VVVIVREAERESKRGVKTTNVGGVKSGCRGYLFLDLKDLILIPFTYPSPQPFESMGKAWLNPK
jgi:hypothetical protein